MTPLSKSWWSNPTKDRQGGKEEILDVKLYGEECLKLLMAWPLYPWTHFSYGDPHKTCTRSNQRASWHPTQAALVGLSGLWKQGEELKASNVEVADTQDYHPLLGASHKPQVIFRTHCFKPGFPHPRISSQTSGKYICLLILRNGTGLQMKRCTGGSIGEGRGSFLFFPDMLLSWILWG